MERRATRRQTGSLPVLPRGFGVPRVPGGLGHGLTPDDRSVIEEVKVAGLNKIIGWDDQTSSRGGDEGNS